MIHYDEGDEDEREEEPREIDTVMVEEPAPCCICGRPGRRYGCFRCGRSVCYSETNYFADTPCGGWLLDTWHDDHPEGNEFYCQICLHANLVDQAGASAAGMLFTMTPDQVLQVTIDGQAPRLLTQDETRTVIAHLYDQRGDLFGKPYDPGQAEQSQEQD